MCEHGTAHTKNVPGRSKPVQIYTSPGPESGKPVYNVAGTLRPGAKQSRTNFLNFEDALQKQQEWEAIRMRGMAASRPKLTWLSYEQLKAEETAVTLAQSAGISPLEAVQLVIQFGSIEKVKDGIKAQRLAEGEPFSVTEAVKHAIAQGLKTTATREVLFETAVEDYLKARNGHISGAHRLRVGQRARSFGKFIGAKKLHEITAQEAKAWVESRAIKKGELTSKSTWNKLVTDLSTMFVYFLDEKWCTNNPFSSIKRFSQKSIGAKQRLRLEVPVCAELMAHIEAQHPKWCTYFALTLFLGIRPDMRTGEIHELARCIKRDGLAPYYSNGVLHLSAEITKESMPREVSVPDNVAAWLQRYPLTPQNVCPGDYKDEDFVSIRRKFQIPHDGLRHTAISAFMANGSSYDIAADQFGNSEPIIKRNYLRRMSAEEGAAFFRIIPKLQK